MKQKLKLLKSDEIGLDRIDMIVEEEKVKWKSLLKVYTMLKKLREYFEHELNPNSKNLKI